MIIARRIFVACLSGLALCGTTSAPHAEDAAHPGATCSAGARAMARTELLFGSQRAHRQPVSQAQWDAFVRLEATPRFPDGFTILDARGQWRSRNGVVSERTRVLLLWHDGSADALRRIESLREIYKRRFGQESVMRVDGADCVSF